MQEDEFRRATRRKIAPLPVTIVQHGDNRWIEQLHFGEILEVSTTGARIQMSSALSFDVGTLIELLCFPENTTGDIDIQAIPCHIAGGVVWKNDASCQIGVEFIPTSMSLN